jgi:hypothetical protein
MRKYLVISVSLLAFLLFSSKQCNSPEDGNAAREETALKVTLDSINKAFEADYLSEQSLRAFEIKAKQKLADLADYLQIYSDPFLDESFKDHTREMILDLFISDSVHIRLNIPGKMKENNLSINEFLKMYPSQVKNSTAFTIDSILMSEPLHKVNDLWYTGSLEFTRRYIVSPQTNSGITQTVNNKVDIIATKVKKQFGTDTLQIWRIFLGDIR